MSSGLSAKDYKIAIELKNFLVKKHGDLIKQIYCYGSRIFAQKDNSDFDIMIITKEKINWKKESEIFGDIYEYGLFKDVQFDVKFFSSDDVTNLYSEMPFIKNVLSYGIQI